MLTAASSLAACRHSSHAADRPPCEPRQPARQGACPARSSDLLGGSPRRHSSVSQLSAQPARQVACRARPDSPYEPLEKAIRVINRVIELGERAKWGADEAVSGSAADSSTGSGSGSSSTQAPAKQEVRSELRPMSSALWCFPACAPGFCIHLPQPLCCACPHAPTLLLQSPL